MVAFAALALLLVACYFIGYQKPADHPPGADLALMFTTTLQFLSLSFGRGPAVSMWPFWAMGVLTLLAITTAVLVVTWRKQPQHRLRTLGLFSVMAATATLALGVGWGRALLYEGAGFEGRYVTLTIPLLCCVYFIWETYQRRAIGRLVQAFLFVLACTVLWTNVLASMAAGQEHRAKMMAFEHDLLEGNPPFVLAKRHGGFLYKDAYEWHEVLAERMQKLKQAHSGLFRELRDKPPLQEIPIPLVPIDMNQMTWQDGIGKGLGDDPYLVFALPQPRLVYGIRVRYAYEDTASPASFQLFWRWTEHNEFTEQERNVVRELSTTAGEQTTTFWVYETIDQIRVDPDTKPCVFRLPEIVLLVPAPAQSRAEEVVIEGSLDGADASLIFGWAWDKMHPDRTLQIDIYDGETRVATVPADQFRPDLRNYGYGNGKHAFSYLTPARLKDGKAHTIRVKTSGTNIELPASPKTISPPPSHSNS
jgi:hypothetical protein